MRKMFAKKAKTYNPALQIPIFGPGLLTGTVIMRAPSPQ
jgi:hypothetical protein